MIVLVRHVFFYLGFVHFPNAKNLVHVKDNKECRFHPETCGLDFSFSIL
jgi:hypothetical protein